VCAGGGNKFPLELLEELRSGTLQELANERKMIAKFTAISYAIPLVIVLGTLLVVLFIVIFGCTISITFP